MHYYGYSIGFDATGRESRAYESGQIPSLMHSVWMRYHITGLQIADVTCCS